MNAATAALVARVLRLREAAGRATLAAAHQAHAAREAQARALREDLAREQEGVVVAAGVTEVGLSSVGAAWQQATRARLAAACDAARHAEAACEAPRAALTATMQLQRGLAELRGREAVAHAHVVARRDPLPILVALAPLFRRRG